MSQIQRKIFINFMIYLFVLAVNEEGMCMTQAETLVYSGKVIIFHNRFNDSLSFILF